jgi:glycosyltransferase involved in cell wall biosynthesis
VITVYTMIFGTHLYSWLLSRIIGTKLIKEISEHPMKDFQSGAFMKGVGHLKIRSELRFTDGILCISKILLEYFRTLGFEERRLIIVPSTVDPARFIGDQHPSPLKFPYIGYFGALTFKRDNVDLLVQAFASLSERYPEMHLVLGGFCSPEERKELEDLISDLGIGSRVELLKYLPREEISRYILHSDMLVMVRAVNFETQASFPSKLIEYLATAKPVISMDIGEIRDYINDGVNAFLVEPGNSRALAEKIDFVLSKYQEAVKVGQNGKQLANTIFSYSYQSKRILNFIETL